MYMSFKPIAWLSPFVNMGPGNIKRFAKIDFPNILGGNILISLNADVLDNCKLKIV